MRKLLIANRGEIAVRIMRTAHDLGLATVAVYSDADTDAPHVETADEAVRLPGTTPADTYLRAELIVAAARATGADAIHPGYGFLSENAAFARAVQAAGLTFVGPTADTIESMGSKLGAKALMQAAGVPVLPGARIDEDTDLAAVLAEVGLPMLVKASAGGGGRGMRLVTAADQLADAVAIARREAGAAFGDPTVFVERFVVDPRHIEVQIVGDRHGTVVHLFERECSIQRRYQKIIEESPSTAVDDALRARLGAAAVAAGAAIGYVGAGTVEFVLDPHGNFYFLEVNTRLQVEHPVTEAITGLDLVDVQLRVARGEPLPNEVRDARINGHAIEVRLYAEDPTAGFRPSTGTLDRFDLPNTVRADAGYRTGGTVSPYYDAMLAKLIAWGRDRDEAADRLARALDQAQIHGVTTNQALLAAILREPDFQAGRTDTGYLTRHDPTVLGAISTDTIRVHALAGALAVQAANRAGTPVLGSLPSGWRNVRSAGQRLELDDLTITYQLAGDQIIAAIDGDPIDATLIAATPDRVDLVIDGVRRRYQVHATDTHLYVDSPLGHTTFIRRARFPDPTAAAVPGSLLAPMPGLVVAVAAALGDKVTAGAPLVVLEAMKMQHTVAAPVDGVLAELPVAVGDQVDTGTVLAVVHAVSEAGNGD
jgi:acetyl-CoA carboxylase biotin carboxylase subunit